MKDLKNLREVSNRVLYGMTADDSLKHRILQRAASGNNLVQNRAFHPLPVFCTVIVFLLTTVVALNSLQPVGTSGTVEINVFAAGTKETVLSEETASEKNGLVLNGINPGNIISVSLSGVGEIIDPQQCAELIQVLTDHTVPSETVSHDNYDVLILRADNGTVVKYDTAEPYLIGDTCWSCEPFFTMIHKIAGK